MHLESDGYLAIIEKRIAIRRSRNFRRSLLMGWTNQETALSPLVTKIKCLNKKITEAKLEIAISQAGELVIEQLDKDPALITKMAQRILKNIADHTDVEIAVNPKDADGIKAAAADISHAGSSARKITIAEDNSLSRGSMIVKANKSVIDAQINTQLQKAKSFIRSQLEIKHGDNN